MKVRVLLLMTGIMGMTLLGACSDDSGSDSGSDAAATTAGDAAGANTTTGTGGSGNAGGEASVVASDLAFNPAELTVAVGETITFTNNDGFAHTFTADNGEFDSDNVDSGGTFEYTPDAAGEIPFHCRIHTSMTGTITVEA
jgi:plastocyanin